MTVVRGRKIFTVIVCREAQVNIWTRLQSYDGCAISYVWVNMWLNENMWVNDTNIRDVAMTSREVARRRALIVRYSGIATRFLNMTQNRQDVVLGPSMAACYVHDHPNLCHRSLRYLKLNARPSHNVVRGCTTIAHYIYEKAVRCLSLIFRVRTCINVVWIATTSYVDFTIPYNPGVIGSDVPWLECPACNALTWVITVTE